MFLWNRDLERFLWVVILIKKDEFMISFYQNNFWTIPGKYRGDSAIDYLGMWSTLLKKLIRKTFGFSSEIALIKAKCSTKFEKTGSGRDSQVANSVSDIFWSVVFDLWI